MEQIGNVKVSSTALILRNESGELTNCKEVDLLTFIEHILSWFMSLIHLNGRSSPCGVHQKCSWIFVQLTQGCWFFSRGSGPTPFLHNCLVSQCSISLQSMCAPWSNSNWALPSLSSCSWPRSCTVGTSSAWSICCYGMYTLIYDFMVFVQIVLRIRVLHKCLYLHWFVHQFSQSAGCTSGFFLLSTFWR